MFRVPETPRRRGLKALARDRRGVVALFVALSIPMLVAGAAFTIDLTSYRLVSSRMQGAADAAALAGVKALDNPTAAVNDAVNFARANVPAAYGEMVTNGDVTIGTYSTAKGFVPGVTADSNAVRVIAERSPQRGNAAERLLSVFWGAQEVTIRREAIAARQLNQQYEPPERILLDNEAWDYNEVYAYCYDNTTKTRVPGTETLVGNNIRVGVDKYNGTKDVTWNGKTIKKGATITSASDIITISQGKINKIASDPIAWPECSKRGQSLSFRLRNYREVKQYPDKWSTAPNYHYYTDTVITNGVESFTGLSQAILETVRCDSLTKCDPSKSGSQVPKGKNRTPKVEANPCIPGKFMYFGWEDRPPSGGSDKDYDDITMVMKCPKAGILGDGKTRLVG